jgi:hypothetical protein
MFSESIRNNLLLNLVSEWKLDGNANDSWGNNNGTEVDIIYKAEEDCISEGCAYFNGSSSYIYTNSNTDLSFGDSVIDTPFTLSVWVNMERRDGFTILNKNNVYRWTNNNYHRIYLYDETTSVSIARNTIELSSYINKWTYLIATYNGNGAIDGIEFYINGVKQTSYDSNTSGTYSAMHNINSPLIIGNDSTYGYIDELQIYNSTLPESQIKQNYLLGLNNLYAKGLINEIEYNNLSKK